MANMTDTTTKYFYETFSDQRLKKSNKKDRYNCGYYRKTSIVATQRLSTLNFARIPSSVSIISDTNKDVFQKNQENLKVISRIKELEKYKEGWYDGIEGIPVPAQAIQDALIFAKNLDFNNINTPYISLARDGEVNFWWDLKTIKLGLGFYGDGTYSYYAKLENGKEFFGDDEDANSTLPSEILEKLKK